MAERYLRARDVLHAQVEGEEVLLNTRTGVYHLVNRTGRELLVRMEAGDSLESAIHALAEGSRRGHRSRSQGRCSVRGSDDRPRTPRARCGLMPEAC